MISTCHPCNTLCATEDQGKRYENHPFEVPVVGVSLFLLCLVSMDDAKELISWSCVSVRALVGSGVDTIGLCRIVCFPFCSYGFWSFGESKNVNFIPNVWRHHQETGIQSRVTICILYIYMYICTNQIEYCKAITGDIDIIYFSIYIYVCFKPLPRFFRWFLFN